MRCFISVFFVFFVGTLVAQSDSVVIRFELVDFRTSEVIPNAKMHIHSDVFYDEKRSTHSGCVIWKRPKNEVGSIEVSHPLYESKSSKYSTKSAQYSDTLVIPIRMQSLRIRTLGEVVIKPPGVPDTVFASDQLSVADFELLPNESIVLLTYPKQLKKGSQLIVQTNQQTIYQREVQDTAVELLRDFKGTVHVVCRNSIEALRFENNAIEEAKLSPKYFFNYVAPIVDTTSLKWYFSNFNKDYPAFSYFSFEREDSVYAKVTEIKDDLMMELYRSEYKWVDVRTKLWAKNKEMETGIDAEIWVGANFFTQSIYYKELYAPLFERNDTLFVFDYYKDQLRKYDRAGDPIDTLPLLHHYHAKKTGWKSQLIQDQSTGEIYALFDRSGYSYLGRIDLTNAEIKETVRLTHRYIDKISLRDNFVFYVYRPFESAQKKFLYKERLPY